MVPDASARDSMVRITTMKSVLLALAIAVALSAIWSLIWGKGKKTSLWDDIDIR